MTSLPASSDFTGGAVTEGQFKTALTGLRDFLSGLLGADGINATALATLGALGSGYAAKTAAYTVVVGDRGKVLNCSGTWTLSLPPAATAGAGFSFAMCNSGTGTITIDPSGVELVDGAATAVLAAGRAALIICTGTAWITMALASTAAGSALAVPGTVGSPGQSFAGDPDTGWYPPAANQLAAALGGVQALLLTSTYAYSAAAIRIGSNAQIPGINTMLTAQSNIAGSANIAVGRYTADVGGPAVVLAKSRDAIGVTSTLLSANDTLGSVLAYGSDGSAFQNAGQLNWLVESAAAGDLRSYLTLRTRGAGGVVSRLNISSEGIVSVAGGMLTLNGNQMGGYQISIADDAVASWTLPKAGGFASVACGGFLGSTSPLEAFSARFWFDAGASLTILKDSGISGVGGSVNVVTTALTGTTGTDGYVTIGVQAGVLQVENRSGVARVFQINVN